MATVRSHVELAQALPPRLLDFFRRWQPPSIAAFGAASQSTPTVRIAEITSSQDPNAPSASEVALPENAVWKKNPFLPFKNPQTGHWHGPHYSLRRQAELFKLAEQHNVLPLMPMSPKHPQAKEQSRIDHGLRVKGTGVGQRVKGHHWERTLKTRLETRRKAMEVMPDMIQLWKERGHGRGWKKYPKGPVSTAKSEVFDQNMRHAWVNQRVPQG
ncbi:Hypothetical protein R9X50_00595300 [Acrodontium crateriforme]|uniref:Large ribosomal subunit protein mL59 domain-containing protein n=1 Tax=Acrodontium crateriforme TaxID=150365 RepID=A0AAQ3M7I1_9PEZI|nr:Hypothetical protein R9X50_00595300 [Acrodontium crateriforme]